MNAYRSEEERLALEIMMNEANEAALAEAANNDEEILPVVIWIEEITSNGLMTIKFNQQLKIPDKILEL